MFSMWLCSTGTWTSLRIPSVSVTVARRVCTRTRKIVDTVQRADGAWGNDKKKEETTTPSCVVRNMTCLTYSFAMAQTVESVRVISASRSSWRRHVQPLDGCAKQEIHFLRVKMISQGIKEQTQVDKCAPSVGMCGAKPVAEEVVTDGVNLFGATPKSEATSKPTASKLVKNRK